jgi:hypothetical protein
MSMPDRLIARIRAFEQGDPGAVLDQQALVEADAVLGRAADADSGGAFAAVQVVAAMLSNLGIALRRRFERTGTGADLDEAITVGRAALAATPTDHPNHAGYLSNLGAK